MSDFDDAKRRAYWAEQMEAGHALVEDILKFEVAECGEDWRGRQSI